MSGAVQRARAAQASWAARSLAERIAALRQLRGVITRHIEEIAATVSHETGKPRMDALSGDVMVVLESMRFNERYADRTLRTRQVGKPALLFSRTTFSERYEPYGVALVIAPWNYPFQLALVPALTALLAGNAVIVKCSERVPATAQLMRRLFEQAGLSNDLVQVTAAGPDDTQALIAERPDILFFTGSSRAGTLVAQHAASLLIPAVLELGGKDACLVFDSCDMQRTLDGVCYGAFANAGQVCVGAKRIFVQNTIFPTFLAAFVKRAASLRIGNGFDADMGAVQFDFLKALIAEQVDDALSHGATLHTPWDRSSDTVPPLILTGVPDSARLITEESFGPVVCVATFDTEQHAIALANESEFALGSSIFSGDAKQARRVAAAMHAGSCTINDCIRSVGNPYAAFGGNGRSGYGRYHGAAGLLSFTRSKTIMENTGSRRQQRHWFPFSRSNYRALQSIMILRHSIQSPLAKLRQALQGFR